MNMNARGEIKPAAGVRQYYKLDPRPVRLKRKFDKWTDDQNLLIDRIGILIVAFLVSLLLNILFDRFRCKTTIKGNGYSIQVEYCDLFKCKKCQKVPERHP